MGSKGKVDDSINLIVDCVTFEISLRRPKK